MKRLIITSLTLALVSTLTLNVVEAQNIAITDDDSYTADPSAMLDVKSISKGLLLPRLTTVQRDAISLPAAGLIVFNSDENSLQIYIGTVWKKLSISSAVLNGTNLEIADAGGTQVVDLSSIVNDADANPANEIQVLSISNDTIYLDNGGFVKLPSGFSGSFNDLTDVPANLDTDVTDDFSGDYNSLTNKPDNVSDFTNDAGYITDGNTNWDNSYGFITDPDDADADSVNEAQSLAGSGTSDIILSDVNGTGGGTITFAGTGATNVTRSGSTITINSTDGTGTDNQNLTYGGIGVDIGISGGTGISLTGWDTDESDDVNNGENVSLLTNDAGYITDGNTGWDNSYGFITDGNSNWNNSYGFITTSDIWTRTGSNTTLQNISDKVGIGTATPSSKLLVKGNSGSGMDEPIFAVTNSDDDTVFAVYPQGVRILVEDDQNKASGNKTGFAVGGFSLSKGTLTNDYLNVTPDSVRIYIEEDDGSKAGGNKGGFAVGGFSLSKETTDNYFNVSGDLSAETISGEARIFWYPLKEAFLSGNVLVQSADSVGTNSWASGYRPKSIGDYSQALGYQTRAFGDNSTAIGNNADARGEDSYAFGNSAFTSGIGSYALGSGARATGIYSVALGTIGVDSTGSSTDATKATGEYSYAIGMGAEATHKGAFSFGTQTNANGDYSLALGYQTTASYWYATSLGYITTSSGQASTALGYKCNASGHYSVAMGNQASAGGTTSLATGVLTSAAGIFSTAMGNSTIASNSCALATGRQTTASGECATAMGRSTIASGSYSFAEGFESQAQQWYCIAMGYNAMATNSWCTAIGRQTTASGTYATALGNTTTASGSNSMAIGFATTASGSNSFAMGREIIAQGSYSVAIALNDQNGATIVDNNTMAIMGGEVGIGTLSPDKILHVVGDARITGNLYYGTGTDIYTKPDFVFTTNYNKQFDILDVEHYINKNGHLPWITAAEDEKDGVNFTRMGFETLEAVENQQLQIIQLKKDYLELQQTKDEKIESLTREIKDLKMEIEKINAKLNTKTN
ncbi:MAG: hypothetical protein KJ607_01435 [Bacteroidetes bacterium]|nr:hypothetical protein [Bacteroidota bacterium]